MQKVQGSKVKLGPTFPSSNHGWVWLGAAYAEQSTKTRVKIL